MLPVHCQLDEASIELAEAPDGPWAVFTDDELAVLEFGWRGVHEDS